MRRKRITAGVAALWCCSALGINQDGVALPEPESVIAAFADDDERWNATRMLWRIRTASRRADDVWVASLYPALELALDSNDWQRRQFAAAALRSFPHYSPSRRMLEVLVEGLRDDDLPRSNDSWTPIQNAAAGTTYLLRHAGLASDSLVDGLESNDAQQQFLCAYVLGMTGNPRGLPGAAEILVDHLRDNDIGGDAVWATAALYRFGARVMPILDATRPVDHQQRRAIALIMADLIDPPRTVREMESRGTIFRPTTAYHDAAMQYEHGRVGLFWPR